jgi:DNA-binding NtrC family response regulator
MRLRGAGNAAICRLAPILNSLTALAYCQMADLNPHGGLILVVDDEPVVLRSVTGALAMAGFRVIVAENGAAGLEAFMAAPDEISLVLTDVVMPFMSGTDLVGRIREIRPNAKIVLMSGYSEAVVLRNSGTRATTFDGL